MKRYILLTILLCLGIVKSEAQMTMTDYDSWGNAWKYEWGTGKIISVDFADENNPIFDSIPAEVGGQPVVALGPIFKDKNIYSTIKLPKTVTSLESTFENCGVCRVENTEQLTEVSGAFYNCWNLDSIQLQNVTDLGYYTFYGCTNLRSVYIPNVTNIGSNVFYECISLQSIDLSKVNTIGGGAFYGCTSLQSINIPNVNTIENAAFYGCTSLQSIDLSKVNTIGSDAFYGCTSLQSINIPNVNTIENAAFYGCTSLQSINIPNVNTIENAAFQGCTSLQSIDLSKVNTIGGGAFYGCTKLQSVNINFSNLVSIADVTFYDCPFTLNYTELDLSNCLEIGANSFNEFTNLKKITFSDKLNTIGTVGYNNPNIFGTAEEVIIKAQNVPAFIAGSIGNTVVFVPEVALNAYKNADNWKNYAGKIFAIGEKTSYDVATTALVNAPGLLNQLDRNKLNNIVTLKVSGTINSYDIMLFRNKMDNLHHLDLSDADIVANPYEYYEGYCTQDSTLDHMSFSYLDKLITIKCPNSVKRIYDAFDNCINLQSVELPEKLEFIGNGNGNSNGTFNKCGKLSNIIFKSCKEIGPYAFMGLNLLKNVTLPEGTTRIGSHAFMECHSLTNINIPEGVKSIEEYAFNRCESLETITTPKGLNRIDSRAFENCNSLSKAIILDGINSIGHYAFRYCNKLQSIELPPSLKTIEAGAFEYCSSLDSISLPGLTHIEGDVFYGCKNLKELKVPSTLESIGDRAFGGCSLEKVYAYTVLPINISQNTFDNFENISLYVPTQSVDNYYLNTQWSQFKEIHEFDEPYTYFYLDKEFTLEKRFDGTPDIDIKEDGGLNVDGKDNQEAGDVTIKGDGDKGNSGTLITDGNLNAKMMRFEISVSANQWYFFSFPFDIKLTDVKAPGEYKWKRHDGSIRADQGSGGFVDLAANEEWLKQGNGYIFQTNQPGILTLRVTKEKFGQLDATNIMPPLYTYPSGNNFDASWNFIGNPQTSYFNVNDLGYNAPITVWNGSSYEAVRPGDDDYTLHPFQAFFVQKPTETNGIEFKAEDRLTKTGSEIRAQQAKVRRLARGIMPSRLIINLSISDGSLTDKTRVVFNDKKSNSYEIDCDAAKFMTLTAAPQLYSVEGKDTKFAINERPIGSVQLGFTAKKSGTYSLSAARMDQPMLLQDKQTGITFDLTNGDYEFTTGAGTFNNRFMLIPSREATGIADIIKQTGVNIMPTEDGLYINGSNGKSVMVYNLNGVEVANRNYDGMLNLATGVYIVKVGNMSTKVMVK